MLITSHLRQGVKLAWRLQKEAVLVNLPYLQGQQKLHTWLLALKGTSLFELLSKTSPAQTIAMN